MDKLIFVLVPGVNGSHIIRLNTIIHVTFNDDTNPGKIKSRILVDLGGDNTGELNSSATVEEINRIIQLELSSIKYL